MHRCIIREIMLNSLSVHAPLPGQPSLAISSRLSGAEIAEDAPVSESRSGELVRTV